MKYHAKSAIIGRKKRETKEDEDYPCFIHLFDIMNPHTSGQVPKEMMDFPHTHKVIIKGLDINYLLMGNDIVINDLTEVEIEFNEGHIYITGVQSHQAE